MTEHGGKIPDLIKERVREQLANHVWSTRLAQQYLLEEFDVAHSQRHVRRLMHKAGVSPKRPRPEPTGADEAEREEFYDTVEEK